MSSLQDYTGVFYHQFPVHLLVRPPRWLPSLAPRSISLRRMFSPTLRCSQRLWRPTWVDLLWPLVWRHSMLWLLGCTTKVKWPFLPYGTVNLIYVAGANVIISVPLYANITHMISKVSLKHKKQTSKFCQNMLCVEIYILRCKGWKYAENCALSLSNMSSLQAGHSF